MKNFIFIVEGNHDIAYLHKILRLLGYSDVKSYDILNPIMKNFLPSKFPFKRDSLNIFNHVPYFFVNDESQIVILNANGESNILRKIDDELSKTIDIIDLITHIIVFADGDLLNKSEKIKSIQNVDYEDMEFEFIKKNDIEATKPCIYVNSKCIPLDYYIFPNNLDIGRLEDVILEGIKITNSDLLELTESFIKDIDENHKSKWDKKNSKYEKALIGIIGNVLLPGSSNTTVICNKNNNWISNDTKDIVGPIKILLNFLSEVTTNE